MLVSGAASGQDRLAQAAQSSAKTITLLTDVVKLGAASIGSDDPETQVARPRFLSSSSSSSSSSFAVPLPLETPDYSRYSPVSLHIVLMRTNVINLLNRVPEHDRKDFFCTTQNEM